MAESDQASTLSRRGALGGLLWVAGRHPWRPWASQSVLGHRDHPGPKKGKRPPQGGGSMEEMTPDKDELTA